jgi:cytochrome c biogenesis protein CcmG/thiol:disulfide interchange protein DsbE
MKARHWIPLAVFGVMVAFLAAGLTRDPHELPSPLVDKPAPRFNLPQLVAGDKRFAPADLEGQVWLLNVWASWCTACREEHPLLVEFSRTQQVPLIGLDYKDQRTDALKFLARNGDPYQLSAHDLDGRAGIDWGVYGVPETFVVDRHGVIRYKHVGPITPEALQATLLPLIERLKRS